MLLEINEDSDDKNNEDYVDDESSTDSDDYGSSNTENGSDHDGDMTEINLHNENTNNNPVHIPS